ncbi:hypothetical protein NPX13_g3553 [Xylaria arbuscula]|uniref:Uncharacterized protein n=1 Tax=Xylaria arbuscula TaxID=114810 RepID=A0A9W8TPF8_9PEZI|nr:hypothetical protein NPX13_g3553 [Xylaria arbuscula]
MPPIPSFYTGLFARLRTAQHDCVHENAGSRRRAGIPATLDMHYPVLTPGAIARTHDSRKICVRPWADEFTSLAAMWRGVWPDGTLVLTRNLLPPLSGISEHSIQFTDFTADNLSYPHFALVFWNQRKYGDPPRNLRPVLLDDEKGDTTSSACAIRANGVKVLSTFS